MTCSDRPEPLELSLANNPDGFDPYNSNVLTVSLGDPAQEVKMTPAMVFNNSGVHITPPCANSSDIECSTSKYGGIYTTTGSTTYRAASFGSWNGSHSNGQSTPDSIFFNELMLLSDDNRLDGFPVVGLGPMLKIPNVLGIGPGSTLVNQAYMAGLTTSRSWSFYAGTTTTPGSLILGGYSDQFIGGDLSGQTSDDSCLICTQVDSISFITVNGTIPILEPGKNPYPAQLEPFDNWMSFPDTVYSDWVRLTNGTEGEQGFTVYDEGYVPQGNLTVTLTNGISVTIPHNDIFTRNAINGNGLLVKPSPDTQIAKIKSSIVTRAGRGGVLGFPFMSHVYIIYDDDRHTLNVSKAAPRATSNGTITRICPSPASSSNNITSIVPSEPRGLSNRNYTGVIAGTVIGSVVFLAVIVAITLFMLNRRQRRWAGNKEKDMPIEKDGFDPSSTDSSPHSEVFREPAEIGGLGKVEMPTPSPLYELPTSTTRA